MDDLISRQAAVERFDYIRPRDPMTNDYTHGIDVGIALCKVAIREQPPAQHGTNLAEVGTDAISREQAIEAFRTYFMDGFDEDKWWNSTHVLAAIEGLPPAEPKRGKWIDNGEAFICSECRSGYKEQPTLMGKPMFEFCPMCGAKMEVKT